MRSVCFVISSRFAASSRLQYERHVQNCCDKPLDKDKYLIKWCGIPSVKTEFSIALIMPGIITMQGNVVLYPQLQFMGFMCATMLISIGVKGGV